MHERALVKKLAEKMREALLNHPGAKPDSFKIRIHPLDFPSEEGFRDHLAQQVGGTVLEGIRLEIRWTHERDLDHVGEILLESLEAYYE